MASVVEEVGVDVEGDRDAGVAEDAVRLGLLFVAVVLIAIS
ncbi:MAG TPA: hypothetical protein VI039_08420 [Solirubrobacterales bacterium]